MIEELKECILSEAQKGNVVFKSAEGLMAAPLDGFINQGIDGLLYDLNRLPETTLTLVDDPKWVNDYAVYLVIKRLKERLDALEQKEQK